MIHFNVWRRSAWMVQWCRVPPLGILYKWWFLLCCFLPVLVLKHGEALWKVSWESIAS